MQKIVYILAVNRSGSTLLDQLLGAHSQIASLGEVHHLPAYSLQDRSLYNPVHPLDCSCGVPIRSCPFWTNVETRLGRPFTTLKLKLRYFRRSEHSGFGMAKFRQVPRHFLNRNPQFALSKASSIIFDMAQVARDSFDLFNAAFQVSGSSYLIDSCKNAFRFRALYNREPERVLGLILVRDYRGIVHSNVKRGQDLRRSAMNLKNHMAQVKVLTADIPSHKLIQVRYEDLCRNPRSELSRICEFLNIEFLDALLTRPSTDTHHIGGSPSKFDPARKAIALDQSYLDAFTLQELNTIRDILGDVATE